MDEILFRLHQRVEALQVMVQGNIMSQNGTELLRQYLAQLRVTMSQLASNDRVAEAQHFFSSNLSNLKQHYANARSNITELIQPAVIYGHLTHFFRNELAINNTFYLIIGLVIGGAGGTMFGWYLACPPITPNFMKAVVAISYRGINAVTSSQKVQVPVLNQQSDELLIRVKAAGLVKLDDRIAKGYAKVLRSLYSKSKESFPVILGRACSGVVEAVGGSSDLFEPGDEVWAITPYYLPGLASELTIIHQNQVSRKPKQLGYIAAASLPYGGFIAMKALEGANLNEATAKNKRIFILGGNSPVGCILGQLLQSWGAHITVSCAPIGIKVAKALGAHDVITLIPENLDSSMAEDELQNSTDLLLKELQLNDPFDTIFLTVESNMKHTQWLNFINKDGCIINTIEPELLSDSFGLILRTIYSFGFYAKRIIEHIFGRQTLPANVILDKLALYVDSYQIRTVVDRVFTPSDSEVAMAHCCSADSIGNTIISFQET
ncbi:reticulon-4-interacting protein 1, mitochondrial-like [Ctenocephalides felis]|uniref:reticulon-4-interacting protein 1, mitochondrial-like n=1 Tax=Ctenocephalides felis TaxID=7515 RepID=UPI000E6E3C4D|nr:reticulon-4-interacting protein 1, mitochondrial-like [Ctenocephalides felis]